MCADTQGVVAEWAVKTHPGKVRSRNEDAYLLWPEKGIFAVADGLGGAPGGAEASQAAVAAIKNELSTTTSLAEWESSQWITFLEKIDQAVHKVAIQQPALRGLGTTLTMLQVSENAKGWLIHVGDSRLYGLTQKADFVRISRDQTVGERFRRQGQPEIAPLYDHVLENCLGFFKPQDAIVSLMDYHTYQTLLLCTDGVSDMLNDTKLESLMRRYFDNPQKLVAAIEEEVLDTEARDNLTALAVSLNSPSG